MAETYIDLPIVDSAFVDKANPETNINGLSEYTFTSKSATQGLFATIQEVPNSIKGRRLYRIECIGEYKGSYGSIQLLACNEYYIPTLITWASMPKTTAIDSFISVLSSSGYDSFLVPNWASQSYSAQEMSLQSSRAISGNGIALIGRLGTNGIRLTLSTASLAIRVYYDDSASAASQVTISSAPTAGYVNPRTPTAFSWSFTKAGVYMPVYPWSQRSGTLFWRKKGASTWNQIAAGTAQNVTVSANTFPAGESIEWYIGATDTYGIASSTSVYEFSTAAGAVTATPVSPADSVETNDSAITFAWNVTSADGQAHSSSELQYSTDGSSWTALASVSGNATSYVCPANTLPSGTVYWRVRAYNVDGTAGAWSSAVSFVAFGAPQAPYVTVQAGGFAVVNWQADGQEAYRILIDGRTIGPFFGTEKSYHFEDYLEIGQHSVSVEVQNSFGLWSQPGQASFNVEKSVYAAPGINRQPGNVGIDAVLVLYNPNASSGYVTGLYLYRDGVKIASLDPTVESQTYTDRFTLGEHTYRIVARYFDVEASYNEQVAGVVVEAYACCPMIAPFDGGEWLPLRLSVDANRVQSFSRTRNVSLRHFSGSAYPVAEIGAAEDETGSYDAAFRTPEELAQFEALFGKPVIMKTPGNQVLIGILSSMEKTFNEFCISVTFTITRMHWRDYLDLSNS